jgi:hypothetical protein
LTLDGPSVSKFRPVTLIPVAALSQVLARIKFKKAALSILPRGWTRHIGNALRHGRTGRVLVFHGPDAIRDRDEFLRRLNSVKPRPMSKGRHKSRSESQIKILKYILTVGAEV